MDKKTTDFGFQEVAEEDKAKKVASVFRSVAQRYDLMNDLMSAGMHRLWKRFAVQISGVKEGGRVLDVAGGTGDLSALFAARVGMTGQVMLTDINGSDARRGGATACSTAAASCRWCSATPNACRSRTIISIARWSASDCAT